MLNFHLFCTVTVLLFFLISILICFVFESKSLYTSLCRQNNVLNIEKHREFNDYLVQYNRNYKGDEYFTRLQNFRASLKEISELNKLDPSAIYGLTKFSDLSKEEFLSMVTSRRRRTGCKSKSFRTCKPFHPGEEDEEGEPYPSYEPRSDSPPAYDWRKKGYISPVLDQKMCLSCWAVSSVGIMEAMLAINEKRLITLSVQEMLDCATGNGCTGGKMFDALRPLCKKNSTITTEDNFRPTTMVQGICSYPESGPKVRLSQLMLQCPMNEDDIANKIAYWGPVAAVVNPTPLQSYVGGVVRYSCHRDPNGYILDHAVQIVGYDKSQINGELPYYIVKNSWGENYGINGYVKIAMYDNVCGIADEIIYVNVTYTK